MDRATLGGQRGAPRTRGAGQQRWRGALGPRALEEGAGAVMPAAAVAA